MWYTDLVYKQTATAVNTYGSVKTTYAAPLTSVSADVQPVTNELVRRNWGLTDEGEYYEVYCASASFDKDDVGTQVKWETEQYLIRVAQVYDKIGMSNHSLLVIQRVI